MDIGEVRQTSLWIATTMRPFQFQELQMPEQTKRGRAQDRAKVAGGQKHETAYEAAKTGTPSAEVRRAVKKVGNSRTKVEAELNRAGKSS
jgi:hypothetical protein